MADVWWAGYDSLPVKGGTYAALAAAAPTYADTGWAGVASMEGGSP